MIRDEGAETLRGHHREAVFDAVGRKANWPAVAGVRIGPEKDLLVAGGRIRAELHLLGLRLSAAGTITGFEPGARIEAAGTAADGHRAVRQHLDSFRSRCAYSPQKRAFIAKTQ
jgi:hypothetical protein